MSKIFFLSVVLISSIGGFSQSRVYVFAGVAGSSGGPYAINKEYTKLFGHPYFDLQWEKKITGPFHALTGVSVYSVAYASDDQFFGSAIEYRGTYLAIPIMGRLNFRNRNSIYIDFGLNPYCVLHANLEETINKWGAPKTVEGNITPYLNRLFMSAKVQGTLAFNRFLVSCFFIIPFEGQHMSRNLSDHWGLNKQQSTFLLNDDVQGDVFGFAAGFRLK